MEIGGVGRASLVIQTVKNLPAMKEIRFNPWVWKIPLEKEMAIHSSIFACRIPWTEAGYSRQSCKELDMTEQLAYIALSFKSRNKIMTPINF